MSKENTQKSCVMTFPSTHYALKAQKILEGHCLEVKAVPVPRQISSDCGIALEFSRLDKEKISEIIKNASVHIEKIYDL